MNTVTSITPESPTILTLDQNGSPHTVQETKNRVNRAFIPYGSLENLRDNPVFRSFLISFMHEQQKMGENFMDALMKSAKRWNNSSFALSQGFRVTTNIGPTKSYRSGGRLIKAENNIHLKQTLGIKDYKTKSICDALEFTERELWPEIIRGKNQYSPGMTSADVQSGKNQYSNRLSSLKNFSKWWKAGWSKRYKELRIAKVSPRDAIRQAGKEYNDQQVSDNTMLNITELLRVYRELTHAK